MIAIRKSDGKVIEVREWRGASDVVYSDPDMNRFYQASELDFNVEEAEEVTIDGWVSVYERMPDKNGRYLVCTDKGQIRDCYYQLTQNGGWWRWPGSKVPSITHWMKLPKLPI